MRTIYVDTSVYGGKFDDEFRYWTDRFFKKITDSNIKIIKSDIIEDELQGAPEVVQKFTTSVPERNIKPVTLTKEAIRLSEQYIKENVVGKSSRADCFHIAIASIEKADLLVSWNFKHIVNIKRIHGYNAVNIKNGYQTL